MSEAERHRRAKALFLELIALSPQLRVSALGRAAAGDADLHAEVESLLRHAGEAERNAQGISLGSDDRIRPRFDAGDMFASRYRIIEELGRGATGEVYRVLDTRLDVEIALKIIHRASPEAIRRLGEEVRLARQITHPAVCRVYDVEESHGEHFLTMELVDGENLATLRSRVGRLSAPKVRQLGVELLRGLAAAHARGILHRDLKPSNVMIDGSGAVRVTDFGIAAYEDRTATAPLAGTPAFMAPEQLERGAPASVQTDLYAAGLILYEALVGSAVTRKDDGVTTRARSARLEDPSKLVDDVDAAFEGVLMRLLATDPGERPRSAAEAADALEEAAGSIHTGTSSAPVRKRSLALLGLVVTGIAVGSVYLGATRRGWLGSEPPMCEQVAEVAGIARNTHDIGIAVLPLADETEERNQSSLAQAIQHQIIDRLEGIGALHVIAEDSSDRFGTDADAAGRELGVDFVSVGRITGRADAPRVELTLYDVHNGERLWSETYVPDADSPIPLEADRAFVTRVTRMLDMDPGNATRPSLAVAETDSSTATLYLRGREHVPPYSEIEFSSSVALLKQVIERNPRWAEAYAAIATAYLTACAVAWIEPAEGYPVARRYAERALVLDPTLCEAHVAIALVAGEYDWDWAAAEGSYQNALKVCPGSAWLHRSRGRFLSTQGRFKEALDATSKALELDPTSALMLQGAAQRFYEAHQYERAVALARIAKRLDPLYPYTYATLGFALIAEGNYRQALDEFDRLIAGMGNSAAGQARRAYAFARAGDDRSATLATAEARRLGDLEPAESVFLALAEHDEDGAVAALASAVAARAPPSIWLTVDPVFEPLRDRDDFRSLVATVGLRFTDD